MVVQQQLLGTQIPSFAHYTHKSFGTNLNVSQEPPPAKKPRKQALMRKSGAASFNGLLIGGTAAVESPKKRGRVPSLKTRISAAAAAQQNSQQPVAPLMNPQGWSFNSAMNGAKGVPDQQFLKQFQQHFLQQQLYQQQRSQQPQGHVNFVGKVTESALCSPPPASVNCVNGTENGMANNKQNHLLGQQLSPTMGPTGFCQSNGQQVVPEYNTSIGVLSSPPHHQHPHSVLLTPPSEHGHQNAQYPALSEKQQQDVNQQLAFQQFSALQAQQQQPVNMNSLIAAFAQQQQNNLASAGVPTSTGIPLTQLPVGTHPNPAMLYAAVMAQQQPGPTAALQALLQQQLAGAYENGQQSAAHAAVMMQLAIQKELQILYQRQHLHQMLSSAVSQQRQSPQQIHQPPLNFVSPPLTHTPASDEASYATSSPHSFAASSSSLLGSNETSRSSPPPTSMTFRPAQNGESAFGSPQPTTTEVAYGDDAFEQSIVTRQGNTFIEKPERRLTEKEMSAIHSLINLREGGNTNAKSHN